jgi:hypothetical protein
LSIGLTDKLPLATPGEFLTLQRLVGNQAIETKLSPAGSPQSPIGDANLKISSVPGMIQRKRHKGAKKERRSRAASELAEYAQTHTIDHTRRVAWGNGIIVESGGGAIPEPSARTKAKWNAMLESYDMHQATTLPPFNCAEAHLWLTLVEAGQTPRDIDVWVVKMDRRKRVHPDSPCANCQQWVRSEFKSLNAV